MNDIQAASKHTQDGKIRAEAKVIKAEKDEKRKKRDDTPKTKQHTGQEKMSLHRGKDKNLLTSQQLSQGKGEEKGKAATLTDTETEPKSDSKSKTREEDFRFDDEGLIIGNITPNLLREVCRKEDKKARRDHRKESRSKFKEEKDVSHKIGYDTMARLLNYLAEEEGHRFSLEVMKKVGEFLSDDDNLYMVKKETNRPNQSRLDRNHSYLDKKVCDTILDGSGHLTSKTQFNRAVLMSRQLIQHGDKLDDEPLQDALLKLLAPLQLETGEKMSEARRQIELRREMSSSKQGSDQFCTKADPDNAQESPAPQKGKMRITVHNEAKEDDSSSKGKFYKGGQFIPGGGRAPTGGIAEKDIAAKATSTETVGSLHAEPTYSPLEPAHSPYLTPDPKPNEGKFYHGGQFLPGGGRAPKGGVTVGMPPVSDSQAFNRCPSPVYMPSEPSYHLEPSFSSSIPNLEGTFYRGGQFLPGGGRAPKGGTFM